MQLHTDHLDALLLFLEQQGVEVKEPKNKFQPTYKFMYAGKPTWGYISGTMAQFHGNSALLERQFKEVILAAQEAHQEE